MKILISVKHNSKSFSLFTMELIDGRRCENRKFEHV